MQTRYFTITDPAQSEVTQAAEILRRGGLLAIPTETVYGLGADGLNESAVRRIFEAKGRPQDNPLILHIPGASWLTRCCKDVPEAAYRLAERFWPGPLTMILPKADCVPYETTGGLDTVGMRCPDHAVTRAIIECADVPVAAPSANRSGRPSCTTAQHVREDMDGRIDGVVDGGACRVGVESTIIDLTVTPPRLLRPGGLPLEALREVLGEVAVDAAVTRKMGEGERPRAPGMKYRHYAPKAPVTVVTGTPKASALTLLQLAAPGAGVIVFDEFAPLFAGQTVHRLGAAEDKLAQAQHVFDALRRFDDEQDVHEIFAQCPDAAGLGLAVGNRLKKAAGFHVLEADEKRKVVGITGGTGAGKTTLLRALERRGACVLDCDALYHEMLQSDFALQSALQQAFPTAFDGGFDRKKLGALVFSDPDALARLDRITREHIPRAVARRIGENDAKLVVIDAIKLHESGLAALCDVTVAVTAPRELRVRRIMLRDGIGEDYARARIAAQKPDGFYTERSDMTFVNDGADTNVSGLPQAEAFADKIINKLKEDTHHE